MVASSLFDVEENLRDSGFGFSTHQMLVENDPINKPMESGVEIERSLGNYFLEGSSKLLKASDSLSDDLDGEAIRATGLPSPTAVSQVQLVEISENEELSSSAYESLPSLTNTHENASPEMPDPQEDFNIVCSASTGSPEFMNSDVISPCEDDAFHLNEQSSIPKEPSVQENELDLDSVEVTTTSHETLEPLAVTSDDLHESMVVTVFQRYGHPSPHEGNCHLSPPLKQYVKPDEVDFYDGIFDSSPSLEGSPSTHIDIGGTKNNVGITYHCVDEQTDDSVHILEMGPHHVIIPESKFEDSAEVFSHGDFMADSLYSMSMSKDDSETAILMARDHAKGVDDHDMVELIKQVCDDIATSKMDERLKEIAHEELSDNDLIVHGLSSGSESVDDPEIELLLVSDGMEFNALQMDKSKQLVSVEPGEDHEISEIDEQQLKDNKCETTLMGNHLESHDSYNDTFDDEMVAVNSPTAFVDVCGQEDIENAKHEMCVVEVPVKSDFLNSPRVEGVLVNNDIAINGVDETDNTIVEEFMEVPLVISQSEEQLLEDTQLKTSGEDSSELVLALETPPVEPFLQIATLNAQQEVENSFNTNQGAVSADEIYVNSTRVNLVQNSESYIEKKVEDQNTSGPSITGVNEMNNSSTEESGEVPLVIPQLEEHFLEDGKVKASGEDSSELEDILETPQVESSLQIANFDAQKEVEDSFNANLGVELVDNTDLDSTIVNLFRNSESYIEEKVEDRNTSDPSITGVDKMNNSSTEESGEVPLVFPQFEEHLLEDGKVKASGEDSSELEDVLETPQVESSLQIANFDAQQEVEDSFNTNLGIELVHNTDLDSSSVNLVQNTESYIEEKVEDRNTSDPSITVVDEMNNASTEEFMKVPLSIPQFEDHLLEDRAVKTSGEDSSELLVALETSRVDSLQIANLNSQKELGDFFNTKNQGIVLEDETELNSVSVNSVQKSESYIEEQVEDRNNSEIAIIDVDETNHAITEEFVEVPSVIPQLEEHLLEDAQIRPSGEESYELVVVLETPPVESFLQIANLNAQQDVEDYFNSKNQGIVLEHATELNIASINLVQKSESYNVEQVEDPNTNDIARTGVNETNNAITEEIVEVPMVISQSKVHLLEDALLKTSRAQSSELVVVLETPPDESSFQVAKLDAQQEVEDSFNNKNEGIVLADETELYFTGTDFVPKSKSYLEEHVEDRATSATVDCYKAIPPEKTEMSYENCYSEFNTSPPLLSGLEDSSRKTHTVRLCSDSEHSNHSSVVDVSRSQFCDEEIDHQTDFNGSFKHAQHYFGSNSNIEVLKIPEKTEQDVGNAMHDHIASFFLSDNLFTPCTYRFQKPDGGIEFDPSLTTEELLCLSYSEVSKDAVFQKSVPCPVSDLNKIAACDSTDLDATASVTETGGNAHIASEVCGAYKQHDSKSIYFIDEKHQTDYSHVPENNIGSPFIEFVAASHEVGGDISSSSSRMDGIRGEAFEDLNSSTGNRVRPQLNAISSRFISEDAASPENFNSEEGFHVPTEPSHSAGCQVEFESSDNFNSMHSSLSIDEAVVVTENRGVISAESDQIPESKEMSYVSVDEEFPFLKTEFQDQLYLESNESSLLLSFHVPKNSTSSKSDNPQEEVDQAIICRSVGHDFHFRGARKLADQFEECVAKESEEAPKDNPRYKQAEEDKLYTGTLILNKTSFHECCGVWDWLRGFRG